jgi:hypothetical protein
VEGAWAPVAIRTELSSAPLAGWWHPGDGCVITIVADSEIGVAPLSPRPPFLHKEALCRTISTGYGR